MIDWLVQGESFSNCNCDHWCPCQFEGSPTHNSCKGVEVFRVDKGHFGDVDLTGVTVALVFEWPGPSLVGIPLHVGHDSRRSEPAHRVRNGPG
jgi:hypothetical protein